MGYPRSRAVTTVGEIVGSREMDSTNGATSESSTATIEIGSPDTARSSRVPTAQQFAAAGVVESEIERDHNCGHDNLAVAFFAMGSQPRSRGDDEIELSLRVWLEDRCCKVQRFGIGHPLAFSAQPGG
jgi:hypothetical protein